MSGLDCDVCGCKLHLDYGNKIIKLQDNKKVGFVKTPILICGGCNSRYIPYFAKNIIDQVYMLLEESPDEDKDNNKEIIEKEICEVEKQDHEISEWYDFNNIKAEFCNEKFIAEKVKFIYDKDDYYFIPGLIRSWKIGFLTPVFFNIEVLLKYMYHPHYGLDIGADTFGYIYKGDEHYVKFGINENNRVIMWLGDINNLSVEEQFYLRSENIPSDHSIGSEFYEAEIEVTWAKASAERTLLKKRLEFNENVRNNFGFSVVQLDTETLRVAKNIRKLLINTNNAFKDLMIPLNELLVESINNKDIRKMIKEKYPELKEELKDKKGIKLLQLWLNKNTENIDVNLEIAPLFVLYDLRLVSAHLYSDKSKEEILNSCCTRLGLSQDERNYIVIANALIEKLTAMYIKFNVSLKIEKRESVKEDGK
ncbi:hypothetical protein [Clostridium intestinale]|uniref:YgiT-type zinc finger protein n=1 Tax=Clostridium intestinale TaxID=36845 RepID=A0A7D6VYX2_9CLOT|nr:hypothetical protein [Clostridium intestinale]QLY78971.1 hypothetical protein HZF06_18065 [Clostridium intestinale]